MEEHAENAAKRKFDIVTVTRELDRVTELWKEKADGVGWEAWKEKVDLHNIMGACACIFKANFDDERDRPPTDEVRAVRKIILAATRETMACSHTGVEMQPYKARPKPEPARTMRMSGSASGR